MSPRQYLRANEVRAPSYPRLLGQKTDRQVRQYPDGAGAEPVSATMQDHLDIVASRLRLNAGAVDWRQGPAPGQGGGGDATRTFERLDGVQNGANTSFTASQKFVPQSLRVIVNGLVQAVSVDGSADFVMYESQGSGTGYDTIILAWAPLAQDTLLADYTPAPIGD